jgi:hypothetical protein
MQFMSNVLNMQRYLDDSPFMNFFAEVQISLAMFCFQNTTGNP